MKKLLIASISILIIGLFLLVYAGYLKLNSNLVTSRTFDNPNQTINLDPVEVNMQNFVQIKVDFKIISDHIKQTEDSDGVKKEALANIPVKLTVVSKNNNKVTYSKSKTISGSTLGSSSAELFDDKIKVNKSVSFGNFKSDDSTMLNILTISPDTEYQAKIETLTIKVYDNVKSVSIFIKTGLLLSFLGFFFSMYAWTKSVNRNNFTTAIILSVLFGGVALDRFYLGYFWLGILKIITFGGCGIWYIVDLILISTKGIKNSIGQQLE